MTNKQTRTNWTTTTHCTCTPRQQGQHTFCVVTGQVRGKLMTSVSGGSIANNYN